MLTVKRKTLVQTPALNKMVMKYHLTTSLAVIPYSALLLPCQVRSKLQDPHFCRSKSCTLKQMFRWQLLYRKCLKDLCQDHGEKKKRSQEMKLVWKWLYWRQTSKEVFCPMLCVTLPILSSDRQTYPESRECKRST